MSPPVPTAFQVPRALLRHLFHKLWKTVWKRRSFTQSFVGYFVEYSKKPYPDRRIAPEGPWKSLKKPHDLSTRAVESRFFRPTSTGGCGKPALVLHRMARAIPPQRQPARPSEPYGEKFWPPRSALHSLSVAIPRDHHSQKQERQDENTLSHKRFSVFNSFHPLYACYYLLFLLFM